MKTKGEPVGPPIQIDLNHLGLCLILHDKDRADPSTYLEAVKVQLRQAYYHLRSDPTLLKFKWEEIDQIAAEVVRSHPCVPCSNNGLN